MNKVWIQGLGVRKVFSIWPVFGIFEHFPSCKPLCVLQPSSACGWRRLQMIKFSLLPLMAGKLGTWAWKKSQHLSYLDYQQVARSGYTCGLKQPLSLYIASTSCCSSALPLHRLRVVSFYLSLWIIFSNNRLQLLPVCCDSETFVFFQAHSLLWAISIL